jgi:hypothetical protein
MISEFRNKFQLGDFVKSDRYEIDNGQVISIETHIAHYTGGFSISGFDYDILYQTEGGNYDVAHISEGHLENI